MRQQSADVQQLDIEDENGARRYGRRSTGGPVAEIGGDNELAAPADFHARYSFVPARNDLPSAQGEAERLVTIPAAVELFPVRQPSGVVHRHGAIRGGLGAVSLHHVLITETGRCLCQSGCIYAEGRAETGGWSVAVAVAGATAGERTGSQEDDEKAVQEILLRCRWIQPKGQDQRTDVSP
jgi:hypothetical protein